MSAPDKEGDRMSFFAELKRRNVYKVAVACAVGAILAAMQRVPMKQPS